MKSLTYQELGHKSDEKTELAAIPLFDSSDFGKGLELSISLFGYELYIDDVLKIKAFFEDYLRIVHEQENKDSTLLKFEYLNWRNEKSVRIVRPIGLFFGKTDYHEEQWLLRGFCLSRGEVRDFALTSITSRIVKGNEKL